MYTSGHGPWMGENVGGGRRLNGDCGGGKPDGVMHSGVVGAVETDSIESPVYPPDEPDPDLETVEFESVLTATAVTVDVEMARTGLCRC